MILDKFIKVGITKGNKSFYKKKGYDVDYGDVMEIPIEELSEKSSYYVRVKCDYCGEEFMVRYSNYVRDTKNTSKCACKNCTGLKRKETLMAKYGVEHTFQIPGVIEKSKKTMNERYGHDNAMKVEIFKEKAVATNLEKYGCEYPRQNEDVEAKLCQTCIKKYGVPYAISSKETSKKSKQTLIDRYGVDNAQYIDGVREKTIKTNLERYGVEYVAQNSEIRAKASKTLQENGSCPTSYPQLYLYDIYGGELNYPCSKYNLDIFLENEKIAIEYNGGGHYLKVKLDMLTEEEFNQKELVRDKIIRRNGIKLIKIISRKDYLPEKEILINMLNISKEYFSTTTHTWIEFDIDNLLMRNAEYKNGISFIFGKLEHIYRKEAS